MGTIVSVSKCYGGKKLFMIQLMNLGGVGREYEQGVLYEALK